MFLSRFRPLLVLLCAFSGSRLLPGAVAVAVPQASSAQTAGAITGESFPHITAEALDKTAIHVPEELAGRQNLLLLSWTREDTAQIESWTAIAEALQHTHFDFRAYRMPVSSSENALSRWWDNNWLRSAETDPEMLHWIVPLYTNVSKLRHALGVASKNHAITAVLVDREGHVLWQAQGASTPSTRAGLTAAVTANR